MTHTRFQLQIDGLTINVYENICCINCNTTIESNTIIQDGLIIDWYTVLQVTVLLNLMR